MFGLYRTTLLVFFVLYGSSSNADDKNNPDGKTGNRLGGKIRIDFPYSSQDFINGSPDDMYSVKLGGGGSFALELEHFYYLNLELGGSLYLNSDRLYGRIGLSPKLLDRRNDDGKGWRLNAGGQLGYMFFHASDPWGESNEKISVKAHMLTLDANVEGTYWWSNRVGFNLRLLLLAGICPNPDGSDEWQYLNGDDPLFLLMIGITVGLALS